MQSLRAIHKANQNHAIQTAKKKKRPFEVTEDDIKWWKLERDTGFFPDLDFPFIYEWKIDGYSKAREHWVAVPHGRDPGKFIGFDLLDSIKENHFYGIVGRNICGVLVVEYVKE